MCLEPCGNNGEARRRSPEPCPSPSSCGGRGRRLLPEPGRAPRGWAWQAHRNPERASGFLALVPRADSQRGGERAYNPIYQLLFPDTNPNSSGCFHTPNTVSFLLRSPAAASSSWAELSGGGGWRSEGPRGSHGRPPQVPCLGLGLWLLGKCFCSFSRSTHRLWGCSVSASSHVARQSHHQNSIQRPHMAPEVLHDT